MKNGAGNGTFSVKFVFHNIFVHICFELKRNKNTVKYQIFKNKIKLHSLKARLPPPFYQLESDPKCILRDPINGAVCVHRCTHHSRIIC